MLIDQHKDQIGQGLSWDDVVDDGEEEEVEETGEKVDQEGQEGFVTLWVPVFRVPGA